jgi:predicted DNA-binding transcriptional regulator AlpA
VADVTLPIKARYVDIKGAAAYLSISIYSLYRFVERRAIPFTPLYPSGTRGKPSLRFDCEALDAWMRKQMVRPVAEQIESCAQRG